MPVLPMFQKTLLPVWSVYSVGCVLPSVEALVGFCVLFGFQTKRALISGSVLMLVLTFGSTLRLDWPTGGIQLMYSLVYSLLLAGTPVNYYSVNYYSIDSRFYLFLKNLRRTVVTFLSSYIPIGVYS